MIFLQPISLELITSVKSHSSSCTWKLDALYDVKKSVLEPSDRDLREIACLSFRGLGPVWINFGSGGISSHR
jgi:hypothetical protein